MHSVKRVQIRENTDQQKTLYLDTCRVVSPIKTPTISFRAANVSFRQPRVQYQLLKQCTARLFLK